MTRRALRVLCPVCRREIPVRRDGRLQAHLATYGRRGKCEGSGGLSARVKLASGHDAVPERSAWDAMTPAAQFNAHDAWSAADALYAELEDMRILGCASPAALDAAESALYRAWDDAEALAPAALIWPAAAEGEPA